MRKWGPRGSPLTSRWDNGVVCVLSHAGVRTEVSQVKTTSLLPLPCQVPSLFSGESSPTPPHSSPVNDIHKNVHLSSDSRKLTWDRLLAWRHKSLSPPDLQEDFRRPEWGFGNCILIQYQWKGFWWKWAKQHTWEQGPGPLKQWGRH
jgi:hypothetical protein